MLFLLWIGISSPTIRNYPIYVTLAPRCRWNNRRILIETNLLRTFWFTVLILWNVTVLLEHLFIADTRKVLCGSRSNFYLPDKTIGNGLDAVNLVEEILTDFLEILSRISDLLLRFIGLEGYQVEIHDISGLVRLLQGGKSWIYLFKYRSLLSFLFILLSSGL